MPHVNDDGVRLLGDDFFGEIEQRIGIHRSHCGRDHFDLATREGPLESLVEHARERCAESVGEARCTRFALHEHAERAGLLLLSKVGRLDADRRCLRRVREKAGDDARIRLQVIRLLRTRDEQRFESSTVTGRSQCQLDPAKHCDRHQQHDEPEQRAPLRLRAGGLIPGSRFRLCRNRLALRPAFPAHRLLPAQKEPAWHPCGCQAGRV